MLLQGEVTMYVGRELYRSGHVHYALGVVSITWPTAHGSRPGSMFTRAYYWHEQACQRATDDMVRVIVEKNPPRRRFTGGLVGWRAGGIVARQVRCRASEWESVICARVRGTSSLGTGQNAMPSTVHSIHEAPGAGADG